MSCFVCENDTITRAVRAMMKEGEVVSAEEQDRLGRELLALNVKAYFHRYPKEAAKTLGEEYKPVPHAADCEEVQLLKSLQCLIYQCSEGKIREESALYARMREAERRLMQEIIGRMPAYQDAKWG